MVWDTINKALTPSIKCRDRIKKAAGLFAGLGHLQPLLLATTNSHYLLDRFCMERCCSGEYISRIVTSIIFMEILSIIVVRLALIMAGTGLYTIMDLKTLGIPKNWLIRQDPDESGAGKLVEHTRKEEPIRDLISIAILWATFLGYLQIFYAFIYGGKKGHMHWFYSSLLIQHFLNSLIAGSIGFWEVGLALWYLVTLPMAPIIVFFYQLIIHSWIRNNGPRDVEYLVVECQIWLALCISCIAAFFWSLGYVIPYISQYKSNNKPYEPTTLNLGSDSPGTEITNLKIWSVTGGQTNKSLTISTTSESAVKVTIKSITVTIDGTGSPPPIIVRRNKEVTVQALQSASDGQPVKAKIEASKSSGTEVKVTLTIITAKAGAVEKTEETGQPEILASRPVPTTVTINKMHLALDNLISIDVKDTSSGTEETATEATVTGYSYSPYPNNYYFSGISNVNNLWNTDWDGGRCFYAEYYKKDTGTNTHALLKLCILGNTLKMKYYGKEGSDWKKIDSEAKFSECVDELQRTGTFSPDSLGSTDSDPGDNFKYSMVFGPWDKPAATWVPLVMQGLSVGAVGSIFPNLIPKTLTCPKTTRTLTVINMFLVTVPHIFNVMLGDMDLLSRIGVGDDWTDKSGGIGWPGSLLLYIIYILAILFAIFNVHYPEWRLSTFLRNNTWFVFLMILFTDVLNETFNAISRAGICSQRSAGGTKKNHPCLHNKIACLMNLTYIPFWLTTTPMMKSYDKEAKLSDISISWKSIQADKTQGREFRSRKCQVDTDCYFMVTKHEDENTLLVTPISHYITLEPFIPLKSHPDTFDNPAEDKIEERLMKLAKGDDTTPSSTLDAKKDGTRKRLAASGNVGWDYDGDVPSDDEEMYPQVKTEVAEDPFGYQNLSIYGHRLKSLLVQQEEREADDELEQYSDGDDAGSQVSVGSKTKSQEKPKSPAKKAKMEEKPTAFEEKIMRFMKQNMGRVTVKVS